MPGWTPAAGQETRFPVQPIARLSFAARTQKKPAL